MSEPAFKVEKGIPQPDRHAARNRKYPWSGMQVGDSFLIPESEAAKLGRNRGGLYSSACYFGDRNGIPQFKIAMRKTEEGLRVWRIA